jgi:hypothetical protein
VLELLHGKEKGSRLQQWSDKFAAYVRSSSFLSKPVEEVFQAYTALSCLERSLQRPVLQQKKRCAETSCQRIANVIGSSWTGPQVAEVARLQKVCPLAADASCSLEQAYFSKSEALGTQGCALALQCQHTTCIRCVDIERALEVRPSLTLQVVTPTRVLYGIHTPLLCRKCNTTYYYDKMVCRVVAEGSEVPWGHVHCYWPGLREYSLNKSGKFAICTQLLHNIVIGLARNK